MLVPSLSALTAMRTGWPCCRRVFFLLPWRTSEFQTGRCVDVTESLNVHRKFADPPRTISRSCVREVHRVPALSSTLHTIRGEEERNSREYTDLMPNYLSLLR
jgi:hypothetical protein